MHKTVIPGAFMMEWLTVCLMLPQRETKYRQKVPDSSRVQNDFLYCKPGLKELLYYGHSINTARLFVVGLAGFHCNYNYDHSKGLHKTITCTGKILHSTFFLLLAYCYKAVCVSGSEAISENQKIKRKWLIWVCYVIMP